MPLLRFYTLRITGHILITLIGLSIGATAGVFAADEAAPVVTPQADEDFAQLSPEDQEVIKIAIRGIYAGDMCFAC